MRYVDKYCGVEEAADDDLVRRVDFACRITKARNTNSEFIIPIPFFCKNGCTNTP